MTINEDDDCDLMMIMMRNGYVGPQKTPDTHACSKNKKQVKKSINLRKKDKAMQIPKGMKQTPFRSLAESQKLLI
jgi:hypothetical protein